MWRSAGTPTYLRRDPEAWWFASAGSAVAVGTLPSLMSLDRGSVVNLTVPSSREHRGVREAPLAPFGIVQTTLSERGEERMRLAVEGAAERAYSWTDAALLAEGYATLTGIEPVSHRPLGYPG